MPSPPRRSGRQRKANTRYTNDILEEDVKQILAIESEDEEQLATQTEIDEATGDAQVVDSDPDFDVAIPAADDAATQGPSDNEDSLLGSGSTRDISEGSDVATPNASDDEDARSIATSAELGETTGGKRHGKRRIQFSRALRSNDEHSRGLLTNWKHSSKETAWAMMFGHHDEDLIPVLIARDTWMAPEDATFPSRRTLGKLVRDGVYGPAVRNGVSEEALRREATEGWDWYQDRRGGRFRKAQKMEEVHDWQRQRLYLPLNPICKQRIVMGPWKEQKLYELGEGDVMDMGEAWPIRETKNQPQHEHFPSQSQSSMTKRNGEAPQNHGTPQPVYRNSQSPQRNAGSSRQNGPEQGDSHQRKPKRYREGWLLNLGRRVQSLSWAPNREGTSFHYLAIACPTTDKQRKSVSEPDDKRSPAFRPSGPYPSNIQVWEFACTRSMGPSKLDMSIKPRVVLVLCTDWGNIRQLKFCPVLREQRPRMAGPSPADQYLGLLGVLSSDGYVRVVDVSVPHPKDHDLPSTPRYLRINSPCFASRPHDTHTIHASFDWLSPTDLAIASANGSLSVYSILSHFQESASNDPSAPSTSSPPPPTPYIHLPSHSPTYIQSLSPAYPSPRPSLIATSSLSGYLSLLSLPTPHLTVSPQRQRTASPVLRFQPHLRAWFAFENAMLIAFFSRSFFSTTAVARGGAALTRLATSRWHPHVVFGTVAGEVIGTNPLRRCLPGEKRRGGCQQVLWEYNWLRGEDVPADLPSLTTSEATQEDAAPREQMAQEQQQQQHSQSSPKSPPPPPPPSHPRDSIYHFPQPRPNGLSRFLTGFLMTRPSLAHGGGGINSNLTKPAGSAQSPTVEPTVGPKGKSNKISDPRSAPPSWGTNPTLSETRWAETIFEEENEVTCLEWGACLENCGWISVGWGSGLVLVEDLAHGDAEE